MTFGRVSFFISLVLVLVLSGWLYLVRSELLSMSQVGNFLAQHQRFLQRFLSPTPSPAAAPRPSHIPSTRVTARRISPAVAPEVSEMDLWNALFSYRASHQRTSLARDESICSYARERVNEHSERLKALEPDQEPLDAHAGFKRDADSGTLFERTGFPAVAENLAYLPDSRTATEIIEWGWDTSTSHREAQLSNEWTHGCVVGTRPFYVALFGRR